MDSHKEITLDLVGLKFKFNSLFEELGEVTWYKKFRRKKYPLTLDSDP